MKVIAQLSKPITKNRQLTAYQGNISQDGYDSDYTAITQNSEGKFVLKVETEFDTLVLASTAMERLNLQ